MMTTYWKTLAGAVVVVVDPSWVGILAVTIPCCWMVLMMLATCWRTWTAEVAVAVVVVVVDPSWL